MEPRFKVGDKVKGSAGIYRVVRVNENPNPYSGQPVYGLKRIDLPPGRRPLLMIEESHLEPAG